MPIMRPTGYPASYNGHRLSSGEVDVLDRDVECMQGEGWTVADGVTQASIGWIERTESGVSDIDSDTGGEGAE